MPLKSFCIFYYHTSVFLRDTLFGILKDQRPPSPAGPEIARAVASRIPAHPQHAVVLSGVRRAGKSILQSQLMRAQDGAFYLNLEDTRLFGLSPEDFPALLEVVEELAETKTVFLDEIQELPEWQRLVRSLLDRGHAVCVTGSNASLLRHELGSKLTGRHLSYEIFPFSYPEFLGYTGGQPGGSTLRAFLDDGGFPGYLQRRDPRILQELLRDIVQRDIAQRHRLRESRHVMNLALFLLANTGRPVSLQSLTKSLGVPTVAGTSRYIEYLQDAYLLFAVPKYSASFKKRVVAPAKYFAVDNGLRRVNSPQFTADLGHRLENAVFLSLRERGARVFYAAEKDKWECDFVTEDLAVQVCAELTPFNRDRELTGLRHALKLPGSRRALVVTLDQRDQLQLDGAPVDVVPAWDWFGR